MDESGITHNRRVGGDIMDNEVNKDKVDPAKVKKQEEEDELEYIHVLLKDQYANFSQLISFRRQPKQKGNSDTYLLFSWQSDLIHFVLAIKSLSKHILTINSELGMSTYEAGNRGWVNSPALLSLIFDISRRLYLSDVDWLASFLVRSGDLRWAIPHGLEYQQVARCGKVSRLHRFDHTVIYFNFNNTRYGLCWRCIFPEYQHYWSNNVHSSVLYNKSKVKPCLKIKPRRTAGSSVCFSTPHEQVSDFLCAFGAEVNVGFSVISPDQNRLQCSWRTGKFIWLLGPTKRRMGSVIFYWGQGMESSSTVTYVAVSMVAVGATVLSTIFVETPMVEGVTLSVRSRCQHLVRGNEKLNSRPSIDSTSIGMGWGSSLGPTSCGHCLRVLRLEGPTRTPLSTAWRWSDHFFTDSSRVWWPASSVSFLMKVSAWSSYGHSFTIVSSNYSMIFTRLRCHVGRIIAFPCCNFTYRLWDLSFTFNNKFSLCINFQLSARTNPRMNLQWT